MLLDGVFPSGPARVGLRRPGQQSAVPLELVVGAPAHPGRPESYLASVFLAAEHGVDWVEHVAYSLRATAAAVRSGNNRGLPPLRMLLGDVPGRSGLMMGFGSSVLMDDSVLWSFRQAYGKAGSSLVVHAVHLPAAAVPEIADRMQPA